MKELFEIPELEIIQLPESDVICTSGGANEIPGFDNGGTWVIPGANN